MLATCCAVGTESDRWYPLGVPPRSEAYLTAIPFWAGCWDTWDEPGLTGQLGVS